MGRKESQPSREPRKDPNYIAYQKALKTGAFEKMEPGTFVAYHEGKLVGTGTDRDMLLRGVRDKGIQGFFLHQVGVPEEVIDIPTPFLVDPRRGKRPSKK